MAQSASVATSEDGIQFPIDPATGRRSTLAAGKSIFATAVEPVDSTAAADILAAADWRSSYPRHVYRLVKLGIQDPDAARAIAVHGLQSLHTRFEFRRNGAVKPLMEAMGAPDGPMLHTAHITGRSQDPPEPLTIPYHGERLRGQRLLDQIARWESANVVEPSHAAALRRVAAHPEWLDLSDQHIALLGAAAEMGPFQWLMGWRANVIAVDVPGPALWENLIAQARAGNGTLALPLSAPPPAAPDDSQLARIAGCNLLTQTPEIAVWLRSFDHPLTVGGYAYLDGADHVRVSLAMDAIMGALTAARDDVRLAFLLTPTDVYAVPRETADAARESYAHWEKQDMLQGTKLWQGSLRAVSGGRLFQPNIDALVVGAGGNQYGIVDCMVLQQGPNYALAKRLQQWRTITAWGQGVGVSCNVAPATTTRSVVKSRPLAAAYAGAHRFGVEIFEPAASNAIMAALLVDDLRRGAEQAVVEPDNPLELFMRGANHNGLWRNPFAPRSVMTIAALFGWREAL